jgi:hypothetical protein
MKKIKLTIGLLSAMAVVSCTDLAVKEKDSVVIQTSTGSFQGVDPVATLSSGYADIRDFGNQADMYSLLEISSDELLCPTRGTDWGDNGVWRSVQQHTWDANHAHVLNAWNNLNSHIFKMNQLLDPASKASAGQIAEGKFLRAYNMFLLFDLFRQIPNRAATDSPLSNPEVMTGQTAIDFIAKDLTDALPNLPAIGPKPNSATLHASQAAANFLLAKLYLNKFVYLNAPSPDAADMNKVIAAVDAITAAGFSLETTRSYFEIFLPSDDTETIYWTDTGNGNRMWAGLHYYQITPDNTGGGWNGFATTADFYNKFSGPGNTNAPGSGQELRRGFVPQSDPMVGDLASYNGSSAKYKWPKIQSEPIINKQTYGLGYGFLVGQQFDSTGNALKDRGGNPLVYSASYPGLTGNDEKTGIRVLKYHPSNGGFVNHEVLFRYPDALLMKAEAILRGGTGTNGDTPTLLVDALRTNQARLAGSLGHAPTLKDILDERGRELYIEGWRRNDQIRFGTFTTITQTMPNDAAYTTVFPIPTNAIASNPNLKQNTGY